MRTVAPSETKKCALDEDFSQKAFDLPQFGHFSAKSLPCPRPAARSLAKNSANKGITHDANTAMATGKTRKTPATRLKNNLMVLHLRAGTTRIGADGETRTPKPKHWLLRPACLPIPPHPHLVLLGTTCFPDFNNSGAIWLPWTDRASPRQSKGGILLDFPEECRLFLLRLRERHRSVWRHLYPKSKHWGRTEGTTPAFPPFG